MARWGIAREFFALLVCAHGSSFARADQPSGSAEISCEGRSIATVAMPRASATSIHITGRAGAWLDIGEAGVDVVIPDAPIGTFKVTVPTRYGRYFVPAGDSFDLSLQRENPSSESIAVMARLLCDREAAAARIAWYRRASSLSSELMPIAKGKPLETLLEEAARLSSTASDRESVALAAHLRAQSLYASNRASDAAAAFADAEDRWTAVQDIPRALAARVGRVEDLIRSGRYTIARKLLTIAAGGADIAPYFSNRLLSSECQIDRYEGKLKAAIACYARPIEWLRSTGERTELASMLLDRADVLRNLGRHSESLKSVTEAHEVAEGPYASLVKGRADLLNYDLLLDVGDIAGAVTHIENSFAEFAEARAVRWEANAMLRAAWLYGQLSAVEEARALLVKARSLLSERDAPARVASAWLLSAEISERAGEQGAALDEARAAEELYGRLGMSLELDDARARIARILLRIGKVDEAEVIARRRRATPMVLPAWALFDIRTALLRGDTRSAGSSLARIATRKLRLTEDIERIELESRWLGQTGRRAQGLRAILDSARRLDRAANAVGNTLLSMLMAHQLESLRDTAMDLATSVPDAAAMAYAWEWLTLASSSPQPSIFSKKSADFDRHVAKQLLEDPSRSSATNALGASRSLLDLLGETGARAGSAAQSAPRTSLRSFQRSLDAATVFVAYLSANGRGLILWVTHDAAALTAGPPPDELRLKTAELTTLVSTPSTPIQRIYELADSLSAALLGGVPQAAPPDTVLVSMGAQFGAIPWPVLRWRSSTRRLVEDATISMVRLVPSCCTTNASARVVDVVTVPQDAGAGVTSVLPAIATTEYDAIRNVMLGSAYDVMLTPATNRDVVASALSRVGGWVHVAMHGQTLAGRIGYSGIWLAGSRHEEPVLVSSIDVLSERVGSELVVLGSCELGRRSPDSRAPSMNFADALVQAGASNVVAAIWPISDSAAEKWVPAFYGSLLQDSRPDFGKAVQRAQQTLLGSRRFRHPYYWASLQHFENRRSEASSER